MPVKINELVIQLKVSETNNQGEKISKPSPSLLSTTEQQKLLLTKDLLRLLEDQQTR